MSYLELPRLTFAGTFLAAPSTINNVDSNYNIKNPVIPVWNPNGVAQFQILQGTESIIPAGANVTPTTIQSLQTTKKLSTSGDLVGQFVISTNTPSAAKLVDLDPDQQFVSQVWGMQVAIGTPGGQQVIGDFTAAYFQQIFWNRNAAGAPSAAYQSLLTNLQWPSSITSPFLQALHDASPEVLSIRFTLDQIDLSSTDNGQPNPNFTLGRIVGAIGPATAGDPTFLNPRGRMIRPLPPPSTPAPSAAAAVTASLPSSDSTSTPASNAVNAIVQSTARVAAYKLEPEQSTVDAAAPATAAFSPTSLLAGATPPAQPDPSTTFTAFNFAPAIFDTSRNTVVIDLANALQFFGDDPVAGGALTATITTATRSIPLGAIDNTLANYTQRAFLFEFPLTKANDITDAQANPIVIELAGTPVMSENPTGAYVDAIDHVVRMDAYSCTTLSLFATIFGGPVPSGQQVTLGPITTEDGDNPAGVLTVTPGSVDPGGNTTFVITSGNPNGVRKYIDGQVYMIPIVWNADTYPDNANAFISVLVWNALTDSSPTWANVQPIFDQFMHLYPGMKAIMNLSDKPTVDRHAARIAALLDAPITSSSHMPVTRDLSDAKRTMIVNYLNATASAAAKGTVTAKGVITD